MNDEITTTVGRDFYSFDGRILEIFGGAPIRFHIRHLHLCVTGPDRKGKWIVQITHGLAGTPRREPHLEVHGRGMGAGPWPGRATGSGTGCHRLHVRAQARLTEPPTRNAPEAWGPGTPCRRHLHAVMN